MLYEDVSFSTFVPIMLSSTVARKYYSHPTNPFLQFGSSDKPCRTKSYVPEKITKVTLDRECIQPDSFTSQIVISATYTAWSGLSCQSDLVLALSDYDRSSDFYRKQLNLTVIWLFIPKVEGDVSSLNFSRLQNVKIHCGVKTLPEVLGLVRNSVVKASS